jgi:hypothetical protein
MHAGEPKFAAVRGDARSAFHAFGVNGFNIDWVGPIALTIACRFPDITIPLTIGTI